MLTELYPVSFPCGLGCHTAWWPQGSWTFYMVSQGFKVSVPGNKVEAALPFLTWLHKHTASHLSHSIDYKSITSPPQFKERRQRPYVLMEGESKNLWTCVMVNFMCQLDWIMGCPDICLNIISECVYEDASI